MTSVKITQLKRDVYQKDFYLGQEMQIKLDFSHSSTSYPLLEKSRT
uniref:Uncharacterized protein n=1 Tax=Anguilla anguilla TaxID=7936 RepID=A0A0E9SD34_ANGAN